jgi:hypothetical protein
MTTAVAEETKTPEIPADGVAPAVPAAPAVAAEKPAESTAGQSDTKPPAGTPQPASGPPETYALALPEGVQWPAESLKAFEDEARADGLSNEAAQARLVRQMDTFYAQVDRDVEAVKAHPTLGGDHLPQTERLANAGLDWLAPKDTPEGRELRALLQASGRSQSVAIVSALMRLGQERAEDRPPTGGGGKPPEKPKTVSETFYNGNPLGLPVENA